MKSNGTFTNLELKVPHDEEVKLRYRWQDAVKNLHDLIQSYSLADQCMVQSFDFDALDEFTNQNSDNCQRIKTLYIHNFYYYIPRPEMEVIIGQGCGGHL